MSKAKTKRVKKVKRASLLAGLAEYGPAKAFDEMAEGRGRVRRVYAGLRDSLQLVDPVRLAEGRASLEASFFASQSLSGLGSCDDFPLSISEKSRPVFQWVRFLGGSG